MSARTRDAAWADLHDPSTSAEVLAEIAAAHPEFASTIAAHPNAYPALKEWARSVTAPSPTVLASEPEPTIPSSSPAGKRPRRLVLGLIAGGIAIVLVGAGVGGWALWSGAFGGAASPQAAVERTLAAAVKGDPIALLGSMAPSEISALRPTFETLATVTDDSDVNYLELVKRIGDAGEVRMTDVTYTTAEIADGIAVVTATAGMITIDGDPNQLAAALVATGDEVIRAAEGGERRSSAELDASVAEYTENLASALRDALPYTIDLAQTADEATGGGGHAFSPWTLVTVDEGGWYVSALLTVAELELRATSRGSSFDDLSSDESILAALRGNEVPSPATFASPEDAALGAAQGFAQAARGDISALAATMSLPERRLIAIYGPARFDEEWLWTDGPYVDFDSVAISASTNGDRSEATIDDFTARYTDADDQSHGGSLRVRGTCWEWTRNGDSYYEEDGYYNDGVYSGSGCFSDWPLSDRLVLDDARIVFIKEQGGWVLSPLHSAGLAAERAAIAVTQLVERGRLSELWNW